MIKNTGTHIYYLELTAVCLSPFCLSFSALSAYIDCFWQVTITNYNK
jgi:hypothetical protein